MTTKGMARFLDYVTQITAHHTSLWFKHNYDHRCITLEMANAVELCEWKRSI